MNNSMSKNFFSTAAVVVVFLTLAIWGVNNAQAEVQVEERSICASHIPDCLSGQYLSAQANLEDVLREDGRKFGLTTVHSDKSEWTVITSGTGQKLPLDELTPEGEEQFFTFAYLGADGVLYLYRQD